MPSAASDLERQLKLVTKTGKFIVGRKEVAGSLKGSKLLVWSASANLPMDLIEQCKTLQIPALRFDGNPIELGRTAGIPYKVSVLSVRSPGDADLESLSNSQDYSIKRAPGMLPSLVDMAKPSVVETETMEKSPDAKSKKKRVTKKEEGPGEEKETKKRSKQKKSEEEVEKKSKSSPKSSKKDEDKKSKKSSALKKTSKKSSDGDDEAGKE